MGILTFNDPEELVGKWIVTQYGTGMAVRYSHGRSQLYVEIETDGAPRHVWVTPLLLLDSEVLDLSLSDPETTEAYLNGTLRLPPASRPEAAVTQQCRCGCELCYTMSSNDFHVREFACACEDDCCG